MALQLYGSNLLEALAQKLYENLEEEHTDVFQPDYIVNQTEGMKNWLTIQLAEKTGIAANIKFLSPNDLILKVAQIIGDSKLNSLSSNILTWIIYSILKEEEFVKKYPDVAAYYISEDISDTKRIALAEKIADLFDQYQIYRHDYIEQWNFEMALKESKNWQEYMWIRVKQICGTEFKDKTEQGKFILKTLQDPDKKEILKKRLPNIHLFGISITTPYHLEILMAVGDIININFYFLNPAPLVYWQDSVSEKYTVFLKRTKNIKKDELIIGNPLLTSWGKIIRDTYYLLFRNDEMLNNYTDIGETEPGTDTLLHKIQNDIFYNLSEINEDEISRNKISLKDLDDGSITINSCYTIAREVEVLHNYLVHLVDKKKEELSARDIVVMVSDIDSYSPFIKAVFENSPYKFKFTIADETFNNGDNLINALKSILAFNVDDFTPENLLSLFEYSFIKKRFSINNINLIRKIIDKANIRFGINGSHDDDSIYLSWKYGVQKIIYSICIGGEDEYVFENEGFYLVDIVEGEDAFEAIRFFYFVNQLINFVEEKSLERPINEWINYTEKIIEGFLWDVTEPVTEDYELLLKKIQSFNIVQSFLEEPVEFEVFSKVFLKHISSETRNSAFANGGITFCSLIPMRSIPFKVVAVMGLNFDKFPRKETSLSFNLLNTEKRRGDRNTKDNDKHLFLETILSAKKYLYLSYIGQSVKDNAFFPPSILVDELLDYIDEGLDKSEVKTKSAKTLIVNHPLHSFSGRYGNEEGLYNYLQFNPEKSINIFAEEKAGVDVNKNIDVNNFIAFFKNPFKYYYKNVLQIVYDEADELLPETEIFSLDNLEVWNLKNDLLKRFKNGNVELEREWKMKGLLPLKNSGRIAYNEISESVEQVYKTFKDYTLNYEEEVVPVNLNIGEYTITGSIENVFNRTLVIIVFSKTIKAKPFLEPYLKYLIGSASGEIDFLNIIDGNGDSYNIKPLTKTESLEKLSMVLEVFNEGQNSIIPFCPDWLKLGADLPNDYTKFLKTIDNIINNERVSADVYLVKEYNNGFFDDETIFEKYCGYAKLLHLPLKELFEISNIKNEIIDG